MNGTMMDTPLHLQHCRPLCGAEHRLDPHQSETLISLLDGWQLSEHGQALFKIVPFENYHQTMAFVNALAFIAHKGFDRFTENVCPVHIRIGDFQGFGIQSVVYGDSGAHALVTMARMVAPHTARSQ